MMLGAGRWLLRSAAALGSARQGAAAAARALSAAASRRTLFVTPPQQSEQQQQQWAGAKIVDSKNWKANVDASKFLCTAPDAVQEELCAYVKPLAAGALTHDTMDSHSVDRNQLKHTEAFLRDIEASHLINGPAAAILQPIANLNSILEIRLAALTMSQLMGECLKQNAQGERSILVFDRDATRQMVDGQRYHQSHEGGSLHTDNVNIPQCWEFMLLTCLQPAVEGGQSILVSASAVYEHFLRTDPQVLETLWRDFWWEYRGFNDAFYRAPILFTNKMGEPCFRWLREYMESAHKRLGVAFTSAQQHALDALTAVTLDPAFQFRHTFRQGEILFANDLQLFHGRTAFLDAAPAQPTYDFEHPVNRLMQRNWVKTASVYRDINQSDYTIPTRHQVTAIMQSN
ncbi:hypothetical protein PTSG_02005 [Salpingoeca rosetta]|uniref:TauD/TfdA-like domain-containing protein n=1 Tax=Salpingoeca rosetta (strain ATCC 50818 / BSB-021) TaxID=946362 RepID=F2TZL3_SALR5|nr:uncharacterized protein PTSG_02005 [Salpingoeca rosetta]EGD79037.1 hypothetical protein PTSG_02005 [Salpingoeca rosetta]|eukprot:XP_004997993.1 hypothetical protein PTSG_02005 [Salpingoeca rosetta]